MSSKILLLIKINNLPLILFIFLLLPSQKSEPSNQAMDKSSQALLKTFEYAIEWSPQIYNLNTDQISYPFIKIGKERVYLNSHFWTLVRLWIQSYQNELHQECPSFNITLDNELLSASKGIKHTHFLDQKVFTPFKSGFKDLVFESADIGARLGKTAFALKITAEVAEALLSKTVGGGGVHVFCSAIDAAILFGTRHIQSAIRSPSLLKELNQNRLHGALKQWWISSRIRKAQKKIYFSFTPFEINEENLIERDKKGPQKWFQDEGHGKTFHWVKKIKKEALKLSQQHFIQVDIDTKDYAPFEANTPLSSMEKSSQVYKKNYQGRRYKRSLFILSRKHKSDHLFTGDAIESKLYKTILWGVYLQEDIIEKTLSTNTNDLANNNESDFNSDNLNHLNKNYPFLGESLIDELIQKHSMSDNSKKTLLNLVADIDYIFDQNKTLESRYLRVLILESAFVSLFYNGVKEGWKNLNPQLNDNYWKQIKSGFEGRLQSGYFSHFVYEWTDFLRNVSLIRNSSELLPYHFESYETLILLFSHLEKLYSHMKTYSNPNDFHQLVSELNEKLKNFRFWKPKKKVFNWTPHLLSSEPRCEELSYL